MKKILIGGFMGVFLLGAVLVAPKVSSADMSNADFQAIVAQLMAVIQSITAQIVVLQAQMGQQNTQLIQSGSISSTNIDTCPEGYKCDPATYTVVKVDSRLNVGTFISPELGISFNYAKQFPDPHYETEVRAGLIAPAAHPHVVGNKAYVSEGTSGQWIEIFSKNINETFEAAIRRHILANYPSSDCKIEINNEGSQYPTTYVIAQITYPPPSSPGAPFWENIDICNPHYAMSNEGRFFVYDSKNPDKFAFVDSGQAAENILDGGISWLTTLRFLNTPTVGTTPSQGPIITSISPAYGPIGTVVEIHGNNLSGFEGDSSAIFERADGKTVQLNSLLSYGDTQRTTLIRAKVEPPCQSGQTVYGAYSGIPSTCDYFEFTPGVYKVYVSPWGKKSNEAQFTVMQ